MTPTADDVKLIQELRAGAEGDIVKLEAVPLGETFYELSEGAREAVVLLLAPALTRLFPETLVLLDPAIAATYAFAEQGFNRETYWEQLADFHDQLGATRGEFFRSEMAIARVADVARTHARAVARDPETFAREIVDKYRRRVAFMLMFDEDLKLHAEVIAEIAPALERRIDACVARHEAHRQAEIERIAREEREAADERARREQERHDAAARFFAARPSHRFIVRGSLLLLGGALADAARGDRLVRDAEQGYAVQPPLTIEELEQLIARTRAADAVTV